MGKIENMFNRQPFLTSRRAYYQELDNDKRERKQQVLEEYPEKEKKFTGKLRARGKAAREKRSKKTGRRTAVDNFDRQHVIHNAGGLGGVMARQGEVVQDHKAWKKATGWKRPRNWRKCGRGKINNPSFKKLQELSEAHINRTSGATLPFTRERHWEQILDDESQGK